MDSEAIPSTTTTTTTTTAVTGPVQMDTVVVFGDSLSDIGKKWKTTTGQLAIGQNEMYVSPTGRFSDCRNWTDFMYEEATGSTLIVNSATASIGLSNFFTTFSKNSVTPQVGTTPCFQYANYAEGGACGFTPHDFIMNHIALTTFKEQVELFKKHCLASQQPLGNTLFIIWFGANDLYTANQKAEVMPVVAQEIAGRQRKLLAEFVKLWNLALLNQAGTCKFIFVDLCRPLTSVRYTKRLQDAEALVRAKLGKRWTPAPAPRLGGAVHGSMHQASNTLNLAKTLKLMSPSSWYQKKNIVELLEEQVQVTKNLEKGVYLFNSTLRKTANENGDLVAEVGDCISEDSLRRLVQANFRLKAGAMGARVSHHVDSNAYDRLVGDEFSTTVDQVHPTDQMYKLIWLEIREVIRRSNCTFGGLNLVPALTPFSHLSVVPTLQAHAAVMNQIGASPQDRLTKTNRGLW